MKLLLNIILITAVSSQLLFPADTLRLQQAIELGLANNYSIRIAQNESRISQNNNTLGNAGFLPKVGVSGGQTNNISTTKQVLYEGKIREKDNAKSNSLNAGLMLNWTLFDGGAMFIEKRRYNELEQMGEIHYRMTVENTLAEIITTYYSIIQQQKNIGMLKKALEISGQRLMLASAKLRLGSASESTYLQSQVDYNADSAALMKQVTSLRNTRAGLNRILVRDIMTDFEVEDSIPMLPMLSYEELMKAVESQNTSILIAGQSKKVSQLDYKLAHTPLYPRISIFTGYNYAQSEWQLGILQSSKSLGPTFGVMLSYTLFDGFNNRRMIRNAGIESESSDISFQATFSEMQLMFYQVYNEYKTTTDLIAFEQQNVELAKKNTRIAFERYKLGEMSDIDFRQTQVKQMEAENRLLLTQFAAKQYETELLRIGGRIIQ